MINSLFEAIVYYLPVFVPLALAVFSVITRLVSGTMELRLGNFLKTYTDIVLGIFSFLIWALISFMQSGQIALNEDLVISFPKIIILLIWDIILLVTAALVSRMEWSKSESRPFWGAQRKQRFADSTMLLVTLFSFILPVFVTTPAKESKPRVAIADYAVVVPYTDPTIALQIGPGRWAGRQLCEVSVVQAKNSEQAKEVAVSKFKDSARSNPMYPRGKEPVKVAILEGFILARAED